MVASSIKHYVLLVLAMLFWGGSWVSARIVVDVAPPMTIGFFRFLSASLLFMLLLSASGPLPHKRYRRDNVKILFLAGLVGIFGYGVFFLFGMQFTTAAQGAIIAGVNPASVSIFAHVIHKEKLDSRWKYIGFVISFLGIVFVIGIQALIEFRLEYLIGNLLVVCAMCTWGLYSSIGKLAMRDLSTIEATAGGVVVGCILFGIGAGFEQFWTLPAMNDPIFWLNALFLGVLVTFAAYIFYFDSIKHLGATRTAVFINLVPVFGTLLSLLILGEVLYWTFIIGLILVVTGILIINFPSSDSISSSVNDNIPQDAEET